jgi:hypothetical protein
MHAISRGEAPEGGFGGGGSDDSAEVERMFTDRARMGGGKDLGDTSPNDAISKLYGQDYLDKAEPAAREYTRDHGSPSGWHTPNYDLLSHKLPLFEAGDRPLFGGAESNAPAGSSVEGGTMFYNDGRRVVPGGVFLNGDSNWHKQVALPHEMTHAYSHPDTVSESATTDALPYYEQPAELDARFAHVKREYYRYSGDLVDSPEKAEAAWKWYEDIRRDRWHGVRPHEDESEWMNPTSKNLFMQRAPQLVSDESAHADRKTACLYIAKRAGVNMGIPPKLAPPERMHHGAGTTPQLKVKVKLSPRLAQTVDVEDTAGGVV